MVQFGRGFPIRGVTEQGVSLAEAAPTVTTGAATGVSATQATLNGTVVPGNQTTTYHFEYGPTVAYGTSIPLPDGAVGSDNTSHAVAQTITGLAPGATYHYRLVATNPSGTINGSDQTLTTLSASLGVAVAKQYEVLDSRPYRIRHIRPQAGGTTVLNTAMGGEWLPSNPTPMSRDFASGQWTGRLGDAGDFQLTFPNTLASDGIPWRSRFSTVGHTEFVEIYRDDQLEHVGVILTDTPDMQQVVLTGQDGWFLLKKAFERDFTTVMAPRDVIERATRVNVPIVADNFSTFNGSTWVSDGGISDLDPIVNGVLQVASSSTTAGISTQTGVVSLPLRDRWSLSATFPNISQSSSTGNLFIELMTGGHGGTAQVQLELNGGGSVQFWVGGTQYGLIAQITSPPASVLVECDGRWIRAFVNGTLVGYAPAPSVTVDTLVIDIQPLEGLGCGFSISEAVLSHFVPFLLRGTDKGDYVLPGSASTYPTGGLTGRYYNDLDLASDTNRLSKLLSPGRTSYQNRQDATISVQANPTPGAGSSNWSVVWFGAIWLPLSRGNITFALYNPTGFYSGNSAARVWVGRTAFGAQLVDQWTWSTGWDYVFTVNAAALGAQDGWYPIKIEYAVDSTANGTAPQFLFQGAGVSFTWTDPGGTLIDARVSNVTVPATSLSPLGCVDNRFQGQSHFDIVQQTGQAYGYQLTCEPMQLESGEFPGRLAPRVREGRDTDEIIERDDIDRRSPIVNYQATEDATDQISSLRGNGAGVQDGSAGQVTTEVLEPPSMLAGLFDLQGWQDATDVTIPSLLQARLNAQLGLQLAPWQNITGDPTARDRLADSFPLTGTVSKFNWRPGDGIRLNLPDVNVVDQTPRQILQITRQFVPGGRTGTQAGFRQRPKEDAYVMRKLVSAALRPQRTFQRQYVTLQGALVADTISAGGFGSYSTLPLLPSDKVIRAEFRISLNGGNQTLQLEVNGTLQSPTYQGLPCNPDITGLATQASSTDSRMYVRIKNTGASSTLAQGVLIVTVLR